MAKGRPSLLTPARRDAIARLVAEGVPSETAAAANGIHAATFYNWLARGRKARDARDAGQKLPATERRYVDFCEAIEKARAGAEVDMLAIIRDAAPKSWQAAAWYLERSMPDKYGRPNRPGADGGAPSDGGKGAVQRAVKHLSDTEPLPGEVDDTVED